MFKRFLASLAALSAVPALAADLPSIKAPIEPALPVVEVADWTGFYIGADLGGVWAQGTATTSLPPAMLKLNGDSIMGGGFVGYNRQYGNFVIGLEGDVQGLGVDARSATLTLQRVQQSLLASINGRLGYAFDRFLVYAIGGVAFSDTKFTSWGTSYSHENVGYDIGGGLEYAFTPNWTVRAEYRYYDFGKTTRNVVITLFNIGFQKTDNTFRVGLAYKFGVAEAVPVIAKY
jgi:outer membrane immunogenic protein